MYTGIIIKAYSSYYFVQTDQQVIRCTLRGRFKQQRFSLLVGDRVNFTCTDTKTGVIEEILPRTNLLMRPLVANIDQVLLTFAAGQPNISISLLDRFLALVALSNLPVVVCINKMELGNSEIIDKIIDDYQQIGYQVLPVSVREQLNIERLRAVIAKKVTVFAGPSGVGKSSLLNLLQPGLSLVTGEVSKKIGRGRHTTRYAELMPFEGGGFVVDTPGFSLTEFVEINESELMYCFPEFLPLITDCRFSTCLHRFEPQCAVKNAVNSGLILDSRYQSYLELLQEIQENKKSRY